MKGQLVLQNCRVSMTVTRRSPDESLVMVSPKPEGSDCGLLVMVPCWFPKLTYCLHSHSSSRQAGLENKAFSRPRLHQLSLSATGFFILRNSVLDPTLWARLLHYSASLFLVSLVQDGQ